jgi:hypothetical protein
LIPLGFWWTSDWIDWIGDVLGARGLTIDWKLIGLNAQKARLYSWPNAANGIDDILAQAARQ